MTPAARLQAAITCLDKILDGAPAEKTLLGWSRGARYAGSKDRAAVRDHVFDALRNRESYAVRGGALTGRGLALGWARMSGAELSLMFSGGYGPEPLTPDEANDPGTPQADHWNMPDAAKQNLTISFGPQAHDIAIELTKRAPVDLRVNLRKAMPRNAQAALQAEGIESTLLDVCDTALRVTQGSRRIKTSKAYTQGWVELQDAGSQRLVQHIVQNADLPKAARVLDFCAGGGGKSLALGAACDLSITAHDINSARMRDLPERAKRAGLAIECQSKLEPAASCAFDLVLCDAPCSGSGAWRRAPDEKWRMTAQSLLQTLTLQSDILETAAQYVGAGGYFAYATCSLFDAENQEQVDEFLKKNRDFKLLTSQRWSPLDGVDGFYVALMARSG